MVDIKPCQRLALIAITNCSICHSEGCRYNNPNAKLDCLAACQITAGRHSSCARVFSPLLSRIRFRTAVDVLISYLSDFIVHLWSDLLLARP